MRPAFIMFITTLGCAVAADPSSVVPRPIMRASTGWSRWEFEGPEPRRAATATASPRGVFVVGGLGRGGPCGDAWRWDGSRWHEVPREGAPSPRIEHVSIWAGDRLCVWGGRLGSSALDDGRCLVDGVWRSMQVEGAPSPRRGHAAIWTGSRMMVFGGRDAEGEALGDGGLYDPVGDRWTPLPEGAPKPRWNAVLALDASRRRVAVWGGAGEALAQGADDAGWLELEALRWSVLSTEGAPVLRTGPHAVVVGETVVSLADPPARLDFARSRWWAMDARDAPRHRGSVTAAAMPGGAFFWGGLDGDGLRNDGATYQVDDDRWTAIPSEGAPAARRDALAFWDGRAVRMLWGEDAQGLRDDCWAYAP